MAHKKASVSGASQHKNPTGKRLGIKLFGGEVTKIGSIILRQKGTKIKPGKGVMLSKDYTIYATKIGKVEYKYLPKKSGQKLVNVV